LILADGTHNISCVSNEPNIITRWSYAGPASTPRGPQRSGRLPVRVRPPVGQVFVDVTNQQSTQHVFYASTSAQMVDLCRRDPNAQDRKASAAA
jgi:hypothetical protein